MFLSPGLTTWPTSLSAGASGPASKFHVQVRPLDPVERHPVRLSSFFEEHGAVLDAGDPAGKRALPADRLPRHHLGEPSGEAAIIRLVAQRPVEARRRYFQRVGLAEIVLPELVFHVEQRAQILADALALRDTDAFVRGLDPSGVRPIDHDAKHHADRLAPELHVEDLEPVALRDALGRAPETG